MRADVNHPPATDGDSRGKAEANRDLVRRFVASVWNGEDLDAIDDLATADLVVHGLGAGVDRTREEFATFHAGLLDAVPDLEHAVEDVVVEGDRAVAYVTARGTPEKQYGALAPTGESFDSVAFQKYRIEDGRIAEVWVLPNAMGMLRQLGIFPDSPGKVLRLMLGALKGRLLGR
jgi:predicted ester cyclase